MKIARKGKIADGAANAHHDQSIITPQEAGRKKVKAGG